MLSPRYALLGALLGMVLALPTTAAAQPIIGNVQVSETSPLLIINGINFGTATPLVWLDFEPLTVVSSSPTQVVANLPPRATGTYLVTLIQGAESAFGEVMIGAVGRLVAPPIGIASPTGGYSSAALSMAASTRNLLTSAEERQTFQWQADPVGNNTNNPSGRLNLNFAAGTGTPAPTGLSIGENGVITFVAGQTFPGVVTGVAAGAGITVSGTATNPTVSVSSGAITSAMIANDTITSADIADGQVGTADLAFDPATQAELDLHRTSADHDARYHTRAEAEALFIPNRTVLNNPGAGVDGSPNATFTNIMLFGSFTKLRAASSLLLMWNGFIRGIGFPFQSNYCEYQVRIDGAAPPGSAGRVHSRLPDSSASATALFTGLSAGLHFVYIYVRGDADQCWINPYNLPQTVIIEEAGI